MTARMLLLYLSHKYKGDWFAMMKAIKAKEPVDRREVEEFAQKQMRPFLTLMDPEYPDALKSIDQPPFVLYYQGNLSLISDFQKCVTLVGSREATSYGSKKSREIAADLAKEGYAIVSGLAKGIDGAALSGAVELGKAVGVLGNGLDCHYPSENAALQDQIAERGLLLSEYPDGVRPSQRNFPNRNRILAALSYLTLLGGSKPHSGTLITAGYALDDGREVACLPYRADEDSGNNLLIRTGACLVQNAQDVLELLPDRAKEK